MRCRKRFHADKARVEAPEQLHGPIAPDLLTKRDAVNCIDAMHLKDILREIQIDGAGLDGAAPLPRVVR